MSSYEELVCRAKDMGHKITPALAADLRKMSGVTDEELQGTYEKVVTEKLATDFKVPRMLMSVRLEGAIPKLRDIK